ncbi:MAG: response regulator, partial [Bdellovibrionales bacterium]|nr:response regulator [Bdellovibrionales bacterium]
EDDTNISTIAKMALEQVGGHTVTHVENGEEALQLALADDPDYDVILLDEMMPGLNGLAVCKSYFEQTQNRKPVIFLSAKSQAADIQEFKDLGDGFIPKPFDPMTLNQSIEEVLSRVANERKSA